MQRRIITAIIPLLMLGLAFRAAADPVLQWSPSNPLMQVDDQLTLSLMLPEALDVRTIEIRVEFDPAVVTSIDGEPGALFDGFNVFADFENTSPGFWYGYSVILGAGDWATGPGELFRWTVAAVDTGITQISPVTVTLLPPGGGDYPDVELTIDQIRVAIPVGAPELTPELPQLSLYPNPFNPRTRLELMLPGGGPGRLEVVDIRGRVVSTPWHGDLPADRPVLVDWTAYDSVGHPLPSGVYTFRLLGSAGQAVWKRGTLLR